MRVRVTNKSSVVGSLHVRRGNDDYPDRPRLMRLEPDQFVEVNVGTHGWLITVGFDAHIVPIPKLLKNKPRRRSNA